MSINSLSGKSVMSLRQTFGSAFGPRLFSRSSSNPEANLENYILLYNTWDEEVISSPHLKSVPPPSLLSSYVLFRQSLPANVIVSLHRHTKVDIYTDDLLSVSPLSLSHKRIIDVLLLALHLLGCPASSEEPLHPDNFVSLNELKT